MYDFHVYDTSQDHHTLFSRFIYDFHAYDASHDHVRCKVVGYHARWRPVPQIIVPTIN